MEKVNQDRMSRRTTIVPPYKTETMLAFEGRG